MAYMLKAKKTHPDVCKEQGAEQRFREVSHAYTVLNDPAQRRLYDSGVSSQDIKAGAAQRRGRRRTCIHAVGSNPGRTRSKC